MNGVSFELILRWGRTFVLRGCDRKVGEIRSDWKLQKRSWLAARSVKVMAFSLYRGRMVTRTELWMRNWFFQGGDFLAPKLWP
jgi:hypothetical protein